MNFLVVVFPVCGYLLDVAVLPVFLVLIPDWMSINYVLLPGAVVLWFPREKRWLFGLFCLCSKSRSLSSMFLYDCSSDGLWCCLTMGGLSCKQRVVDVVWGTILGSCLTLSLIFVGIWRLTELCKEVPWSNPGSFLGCRCLRQIERVDDCCYCCLLFRRKCLDFCRGLGQHWVDIVSNAPDACMASSMILFKLMPSSVENFRKSVISFISGGGTVVSFLFKRRKRSTTGWILVFNSSMKSLENTDSL